MCSMCRVPATRSSRCWPLHSPPTCHLWKACGWPIMPPALSSRSSARPASRATNWPSPWRPSTPPPRSMTAACWIARREWRCGPPGRATNSPSASPTAAST
ncbi:hypothetical protein KC19_11G110100 [Ceratodon purpureus]|uniref:Uncharacterized protein n=1 Tax=Ceratodon purpureus TaxID=3225 RepID=A0A8T0GDU8_CERPU|nr:hypothetical protein KC19_11G110100 [Ceratodon purpureus]